MPEANPDKEALRLAAYLKAQDLWADLTPNEKTAVRAGMFPAARLQAAIAEGHDGHALSVELMNCARKDGGMFA